MQKVGVVLVVLFMGSLLFLRPPKPCDLTVVGAVNIKDGLGRQAVELVDTFRDEMKVNFVPVSNVCSRHLAKEWKKILRKSKRPKWGNVLIYEDVIWSPEKSTHFVFDSCGEKTIRIAYSMWESTKIPEEWVRLINEKFDAVCVPSTFLIDVYKNSGVSKPVFKLPLGLHYRKFARAPLKRQKGTPMIFGNFAACSDRKNQIALVKAFHKAFADRTDVLLRINVRYADKGPREEITKYIAENEMENVKFTNFVLSPKSYFLEMQKVDCYVNPSKGEGFSIQPREAMMLGIPVIVTDNTGQSDICASGLVKAIRSDKALPAYYPWGEYYGKNFSCDVDELAGAMLEIADNYEFFLKRGKQARAWAQGFDYDNLASKYRSMIKPSRVILCNENQIIEGGLKTSSPALFKKYRKLFKKDGCLFSNQRV